MPSPVNTGPVTAVESQLLQIATMNATNIIDLKADFKEHCLKENNIITVVNQLSVDVRDMKASYDTAIAISKEAMKPGLSGKNATGIAVGVSAGVMSVVEAIKWAITFFKG